MKSRQEFVHDVIEQIDEFRASPRFNHDDAAFLHNKGYLIQTLGADGADAVMGAAAALRRENPHIAVDEIWRIRAAMVDRFWFRNAANAAAQIETTGPASGNIKTYRARMLSIAAEGDSAVPSCSGWRDAMRSGVALLIYAAAALAVWLYFTPAIEGLFVERFGISEPVAAALPWLVPLAAYCGLMFALWYRVKVFLVGLIETRPARNRQDHTFMPAYIAFALVGGITITLGLLVFDYQAHTAASVVADHKALGVNDAVATQDPFFGFTAAPQPRSDVTSSPVADFGSFAGTFGDFFGGVLNPILTFGTLIALGVTLLMQRTQLIDEKIRGSEAAAVSIIQTFETTFFNLLNLQSSILSGLRFSPHRVQLPSAQADIATSNQQGDSTTAADHSAVNGREVFTEVLRTIHALANDSEMGRSENHQYLGFSGIYSLIQEKHNHVLGHYFRNLYQILAFVDRYATQLQPNGIEEEYVIRKRYTNILRAQLSAHELCILFFNCRRRLVDNGAFRNLLIEWEILEHMPVRYSHLNHALYIEGYEDEFLSHMIGEYLGDTEVMQSEAGAFGQNPQVEEFLRMRRLMMPSKQAAA